MFVHLQCYSEYSLIKSLINIDSFVFEVKNRSMPAVALTDENNLFAAVKFYKQALFYGIKPIIGCDVFIKDEEKPSKEYRLILLCKNYIGYKIINKLLIRANIFSGDKNYPIIYKNWLFDNDGLIVIFPNKNMYSLNYDLKQKIDIDLDIIKYFFDIFKDKFYLGISKIGNIYEQFYNDEILKISYNLNISVVAINDVCFLNKEEFDAHEARVCINQAQYLSDYKLYSKYTNQQFLKNYKQMEQLFFNIPECLENTLEIAKRCNYMFDFDNMYLPCYFIFDSISVDNYLYKIAKISLNNKLRILKKLIDINLLQENEYISRLEYELNIIKDMKFSEYFLIVADFINWAKISNIPVGPGRGSGAGSLVAYVLSITNIDPIEYNLLFERFLNPMRLSMPDFDIDFCIEGRDDVIDYAFSVYGYNFVAQIITFGTMATKAAIRDVGRILGFRYGFIEKIYKYISNNGEKNLKQILETNEKFLNKCKSENDLFIIVNLAKMIEGLVRNISKHAGGIVISPFDMINYMSLYYDVNEIYPLSQFDKEDLESLGLLKFDFLGLKTLTIIYSSVIDINIKKIKYNECEIDINNVPLNDTKTFLLLQKFITSAVFQLESQSMKELIKKLKPSDFEEIIDLVALIRPGPMQSGMSNDFIKRKFGLQSVIYPHFLLKPILEKSKGMILYQEQVMQIAQILSGYTLAEADLLRRAISKKNFLEMCMHKKTFIDGAKKKGIIEEVSSYIFDLIDKFAGYGFNKSHSAAYSLLTYQTAWLKAHYPLEFMASVLSIDIASGDKIVYYMEDCYKMGLKIVCPDINKSFKKFYVDDFNNIIFGFNGIKWTNDLIVSALIEERCKGFYKDIYDLCFRFDYKDYSKNFMEGLIKSGALDCFYLAREKMIVIFKLLIKIYGLLNNYYKKLQINLFDIEIKKGFFDKFNFYNSWSEYRSLLNEREALGLFLSGNLMYIYFQELYYIVSSNLFDIYYSNLYFYIICGFVINIRYAINKNNKKMGFLLIENMNYYQEIVLYDNIINNSFFLKKGNLVVIYVKCDKDLYFNNFKLIGLKIKNLDEIRFLYVIYIQIYINYKFVNSEFLKLLFHVICLYKGGKTSVYITNKFYDKIITFKLNNIFLIKPYIDFIERIKSFVAVQSVIIYYK
ncbi:MAG: DNA polymerase III subunit alpha [Candidatus Azosocius agrarius]|nr:MAG: DNA polymerase III subunit alpha [Gammaproteobacteria bacterium]